MICNQTSTGWELIYQQAHALLSAELLARWRKEDRPARWYETLNAVAQHDNGWQEWESGVHLTEAGTPLPFTHTPVEDIVVQAERAVMRAWRQSRWCGLLVSRHLSHLHERHRGEEPRLDRLLDRLIDWREEWRHGLGVKKAEVEHAYALLLLADAFSLALCCNSLPIDERALELGVGPDGVRYDALMRQDGSVAVTPWPYEAASFEVGVDIYPVNEATFRDERTLAHSLREASAQRRCWEIRAK